MDTIFIPFPDNVLIAAYLMLFLICMLFGFLVTRVATQMAWAG